MRGKENPLWDAEFEPQGWGPREFVVQIGKGAGGVMWARLIVRMPAGSSVISLKGTYGEVFSMGEIVDLCSTLQDAVAREATVLGGVQLTL
jgi:hypothetical protein